MIIIIMGPQGSGKGTQADKLADKFDMIHVSTGDILRDEVQRHGKYEDIVKECMNKGELVPDKINDAIVKKVVERYKKGLILDGYPRSMHQAQEILNMTKIDYIVSLNIDDETAVERISKRLICTSNHKVFIEGKITKEDIKECEDSGGKIIKREDDTPENVKSRLKVYHEETAPIIDYFKKQKQNVIEVDATKPINEVYEDILKLMN